MELRKETLASVVGLTRKSSTLDVYLANYQFAHIKKQKVNGIWYYLNVTEKDIELLRETFNRKRRGGNNE